jgi:3alpha(or 20beta)-hydroxysteroid dehydrogenase
VQTTFIAVARLQGKVALITGAAGGLGAALARAFVAEGAQVVVTDVRLDAVRALAHELGSSASFAPLDVTSETGWATTIGDVVRDHGRIDVVVNNAAVLLVGPILDYSVDDFRTSVEVNQIGCFLGVQAAARAMIAGRGGSIINIGSVDGLRGTPGVAGYASTKWAVRGITRVAAVELGPSNVRVNAILPGGMSTAMAAPAINLQMRLRPAEQIVGGWPLGRLAHPDEIAPLAVFLASDESAFCTGSEFVIDGGATSGPDYLDRTPSS